MNNSRPVQCLSLSNILSKKVFRSMSNCHFKRKKCAKYHKWTPLNYKQIVFLLQATSTLQILLKYNCKANVREESFYVFSSGTSQKQILIKMFLAKEFYKFLMKITLNLLLHFQVSTIYNNSKHQVNGFIMIYFKLYIFFLCH